MNVGLQITLMVKKNIQGLANMSFSSVLFFVPWKEKLACTVFLLYLFLYRVYKGVHYIYKSDYTDSKEPLMATQLLEQKALLMANWKK